MFNFRAAERILRRVEGTTSRRSSSSKRSSVITKDGAKISYTLHRGGGEATPLIMINGWTCTGNFWGSLLANGQPRFVGEERDVVTYDLRGSGDSDVTDGPYDVNMLAEDANALIDDLELSGKVHVLGLSLGGMIAQQLAASYPEKLASLVLCCTTAGGKRMIAANKDDARTFFGSFRNFDDEKSKMKAARTFVEYGLATNNQNVESSLVDSLTRSYLSESKCTVEGINAQFGALNWKGIKDEESPSELPVLIVHGTEDRILPYGNVEGIREIWPRSRVLSLSGHGHFWNVTNENAARTIASFLEDVDQGDDKIKDAYVC